MNKILVVSFCVLGLALSGVVANAKPTEKQITLECSTTDSDTITGFVMVTLCDAADCSGEQSDCVAATQPPPLPSISFVSAVCDSANVPAITVTCSTPFRVRGQMSVIGYVEASHPDQPHSTPHSGELKGKGFYTLYGGDMDQNGDSETVSLTIK